MTALPRTLLWQRTDGPGSELVHLDDRSGLTARGTMLGRSEDGRRLPYATRYELHTDSSWATTLLTVETEGAGWRRTLRLERRPDGWRVRASEEGRLDGTQPGSELPEEFAGALDVDLFPSALTNTLPVRRLGLLGAPAGTRHELRMAYVTGPELAVVAADQTYTALGDGRVRFATGDFTADVDLDADGYVTRYPGLASRPT